MGTTVGFSPASDAGRTDEWRRLHDLAMAAQPRGVAGNAGYVPWGNGDGRATGHEVGDQAAATALGNEVVDAIRRITDGLEWSDPVKAAGERHMLRFRALADAYAQPMSVPRVPPANFADEACSALRELREARRLGDERRASGRPVGGRRVGM